MGQPRGRGDERLAAGEITYHEIIEMIELFPFGDSHTDRRNVFLTEVKIYKRKPAFILGLVMWTISLSGLIGLMATQNWWLFPIGLLNIFGCALIYDSAVAHFCDKVLELRQPSIDVVSDAATSEPPLI
jgi:hypothetical protein